MNREIKFRAFDDKRKKMLTDGIDKVTNLWLMTFYPNQLMQYTGLKDKNGVEIYEGDVLKYEYYRDKETKVSFSEAVEWDEMMEFTGFTIHKNMQMEVIGNIYENPDLLTTN